MKKKKKYEEIKLYIVSLNNGFKDEDPVPLKMLITFLSGIYRDVTSWEKLLPPTFFFFFCCDLLGENSYPVALSRSQKTTCGNGGSEFPRRRDTEGGCSVRFDYNASGRALAVSRSEEVSVGLPPLIQNLRAATSGQAEQVYGSVGLHLTSAESRRRRLFCITGRFGEAGVPTRAALAPLAAASG